MAAAWLVTKWLHEGRFTWPPTCDALSLEIGAVGVIGDHCLRISFLLCCPNPA
jgi:hypothetical protein